MHPSIHIRTHTRAHTHARTRTHDRPFDSLSPKNSTPKRYSLTPVSTMDFWKLRNSRSYGNLLSFSALASCACGTKMGSSSSCTHTHPPTHTHTHKHARIHTNTCTNTCKKEMTCGNARLQQINKDLQALCLPCKTAGAHLENLTAVSKRKRCGAILQCRTRGKEPTCTYAKRCNSQHQNRIQPQSHTHTHTDTHTHTHTHTQTHTHTHRHTQARVTQARVT